MEWTAFYKTENELIADMEKTISADAPNYKLVKGFEYIEGFKAAMFRDGYLTEKQIRQLKRLAGDVYKNVHGEKEYWKIARWA